MKDDLVEKRTDLRRVQEEISKLNDEAEGVAARSKLLENGVTLCFLFFRGGMYSCRGMPAMGGRVVGEGVDLCLHR